MYTGTLIDDLIATVQQAESSLRPQPQQEFNLAWFAVARNEAANLYSLAGVA